MTEITITVTGAEAIAQKTGPITTGMVGIPVRFHFDDAWENLHIVPVFAAGEDIRDGVLQENQTTVPHELLTQAGQQLRIGCEGRNADGSLVIPTTWANVGTILPGAEVSGEAALEPTPDRYNALEQRLTALEQNPVKPDWSAAEDVPGHIQNRTHYTECVKAALVENVTMRNGMMYSGVTYDRLQGCDSAEVVFDGETFQCPVTFRESITEYGDESYFYLGNFQGGAPQYPFSFWGYVGKNYATFNAAEGSHILSVYAKTKEVIHKLDKKYLPDDLGGGVTSWNDLTDRPFYTLEADPVFDGDITGREHILFDSNQGAYAVKVTPQSVSVSDMIGASMVVNMGGAEQTITLTDAMVFDAALVFSTPGAVAVQGEDPVVLSLPEDANILGIDFSAGTWFMCIPGMFYVKSLSCLMKEVVQKLDDKYLPVTGVNANPIYLSFLLSDLPYVRYGNRETAYVGQDFIQQLKTGMVNVSFPYRRFASDTKDKTAVVNLIPSDVITTANVPMMYLRGFLEAETELVLVSGTLTLHNDGISGDIAICLTPIRTKRNPQGGWQTYPFYQSAVVRSSQSGDFFLLDVDGDGNVIAAKLQ